mmetsp:Transcript_12918/g.12809  ORF Transcript_12918/g.12809 Transcript_12918/m.12809 type:complete len:134 (+) Transcript_12918:840-1241(+)
MPLGRNGHSVVIFKDKMILFGGIIEVTKESDEVFIYDPVINTWKLVDTSGQIHEGMSPAVIPSHMQHEPSSNDINMTHGLGLQKTLSKSKGKQTASYPVLATVGDVTLAHSKSTKPVNFNSPKKTVASPNLKS